MEELKKKTNYLVYETDFDGSNVIKYPMIKVQFISLIKEQLGLICYDKHEMNLNFSFQLDIELF